MQLHLAIASDDEDDDDMPLTLISQGCYHFYLNGTS